MSSDGGMTIGRLTGAARALLERPSSGSLERPSSESSSEPLEVQPSRENQHGSSSSDFLEPPSSDSLERASSDRQIVARELDAISEASGVGLEDLAQAFMTIRPEMTSDENALEALAAVARQCRDLGKTAPELATLLVAASKKPEGHQPAPRLWVPERSGQIIVPGGQRSAPLPPERDLTTGEVDPEAARMVGEGRARYHLDTLAELDAESRRKPAPMRRAVGSVLALSTVAMMAALHEPIADETLEVLGGGPSPAPRPATRAPGVQTRQAQPPAKPKAQEAAAEKKPGCRSAGCRTLKDCLCTCGDCEVDCYDRKPPRRA